MRSSAPMASIYSFKIPKSPTMHYKRISIQPSKKAPGRSHGQRFSHTPRNPINFNNPGRPHRPRAYRLPSLSHIIANSPAIPSSVSPKNPFLPMIIAAQARNNNNKC